MYAEAYIDARLPQKIRINSIFTARRSRHDLHDPARSLVTERPWIKIRFGMGDSERQRNWQAEIERFGYHHGTECAAIHTLGVCASLMCCKTDEKQNGESRDSDD